MPKYLYIFFLFLFSFNASAKLTSGELDRLYNEVAVGDIANIDFKESIADLLVTLESKNATVEDRLKSYLILGFLYRIEGNTKASIAIAEKGQTYAEKNKEFLWQARLNGFISTAYRQRNELALSKERLMYAMDVAKKAPNTVGIVWFNLNANKELAYHASFANDIPEAVHYTEESIKWAEKLGNVGSSYLIAVNYHYIGILYASSKQGKQALSNYQKALVLVSQIKNNAKAPVLRNQILIDIGEEYMRQNKFDEAYGYFTRVVNDYNGSKP